MIELKHVPGRGRAVITTRLIKTGESLIQELPTVLTVAQEAKDVACVNCLRLASEHQSGFM